jgi:hypothetical protein
MVGSAKCIRSDRADCARMTYPEVIPWPSEPAACAWASSDGGTSRKIEANGTLFCIIVGIHESLPVRPLSRCACLYGSTTGKRRYGLPVPDNYRIGRNPGP